MTDAPDFMYGGIAETVRDPADHGLAVDLSTTDATLADPARGLYVGVAGDITMRGTHDTADILFKAVPVGVLPYRASIIRKVGTTATNIVALY